MNQSSSSERKFSEEVRSHACGKVLSNVSPWRWEPLVSVNVLGSKQFSQFETFHYVLMEAYIILFLGNIFLP
jgi:hypothetical protein